jgi:hypothetical protein
MEENFNINTAILVFFTYVLIDVLYALYIIFVEKRQAFYSAVVSSLIYSFGALGILSFSKNVYYIIPLALGAFLGTYVTVLVKKNK